MNTFRSYNYINNLHQQSGIRYVSRSFSVRHLVSLAYWKGLISMVTLSVVVPQAIGSFLCNMGVSCKRRPVDMIYGCVWGCLGVVGYRLGCVSGKHGGFTC